MLRPVRISDYPLHWFDNRLHDSYYPLHCSVAESFGNYYPPVFSGAKTSCFDCLTQGSGIGALSCNGGAFGSDFEAFGCNYPLHFSDF